MRHSPPGSLNQWIWGRCRGPWSGTAKARSAATAADGSSSPATARRSVACSARRSSCSSPPSTRASLSGAHDYLERSFLPGRVLTGPGDFNTQLQSWLALVNTRTRRALGCAPYGPDRRRPASDADAAPGRSSHRMAVLAEAGPGPLRPVGLQRLLGASRGDRTLDLGRRNLDRVKVFSDGRTVAGCREFRERPCPRLRRPAELAELPARCAATRSRAPGR